ncbi:MAG: VTT domain-containing protein [Pseudomonadota bacterium]
MGQPRERILFGLEAADMGMMSGWVLYLSIFALPFLQEDAAVIGAATASLAGAAPTAFIVIAIMLGLICSDAWKYWLGRFARRHDWAHKFAEKPGVSVAGDLVRKEFTQTMLTARFVPGTRIPTYIACGFFKVDYPRYIIVLALTASAYVAITFILFHTLGAVIGEQAKYWLPVIAVACLAIYICVRWLNHVNKHEGPMTPMSTQFDREAAAASDDAAETADITTEDEERAREESAPQKMEV